MRPLTLSMPGDVLKSESVEKWQRERVKCLIMRGGYRLISSIGNLSYFPRKEARHEARRNVPKVDAALSDVFLLGVRAAHLATRQ